MRKVFCVEPVFRAFGAFGPVAIVRLHGKSKDMRQTMAPKVRENRPISSHFRSVLEQYTSKREHHTMH